VPGEGLWCQALLAGIYAARTVGFNIEIAAVYPANSAWHHNPLSHGNNSYLGSFVPIMQADKIKKFMTLAGQTLPESFVTGTDSQRQLGAQLLLSEVLEYVIKGLGVTPIVNGAPITDPNGLEYQKSEVTADKMEMLDGLADVAYTMYWNACAFNIPLEEGFEVVCDNNLEKFVKLDNGIDNSTNLNKEQWDCGKDISWPNEVESVEVVKVGKEQFAVGKDKTGKVRKPSSYRSVDLSELAR